MRPLLLPSLLLLLPLPSLLLVKPKHGIIGLKSGVTRRWLGQTFLGYLRVSGTSFGKNHEWQVDALVLLCCNFGRTVLSCFLQARPDADM